MNQLQAYIESLLLDGIAVDLVRMNPPPPADFGVAIELYPEPEPFAELYSAGVLVARVNLG